MLRRGLIRKSKVMQGFIEPVSAPITGEDTSRSIPPVGSRRQTQDVQARIGIAESRNRPVSAHSQETRRRLAGHGRVRGFQPAVSDSRSTGGADRTREGNFREIR